MLNDIAYISIIHSSFPIFVISPKIVSTSLPHLLDQYVLISLFMSLCGQVVTKPTLSNHLDGAQSVFQYFENVRNFLLAVEEMGLPSFEVSDLEQVLNRMFNVQTLSLFVLKSLSCTSGI